LPDPLAKAAWKQLLPQLQKMGILSRIDANALVRYCRRPHADFKYRPGWVTRWTKRIDACLATTAVRSGIS
jgi:hypothetical protein